MRRWIRKTSALVVLALCVSMAPAVPASSQAGSGPSTPLIVRNGIWYLRNTNTGGGADVSFGFGNPSDIPLQGRWSSGAQRTPAVVRNGLWFLRSSNTTGPADLTFAFGDPWDTPLVGDWNGDGVDTPAVVRDGIWYLRNSNTSGPADAAIAFGDPWDTPLVGDWNGDGVDTPAVVRNGVWFLRNSNSTGPAESRFAYGNPLDAPIAGDWNGDGVDTAGVVRDAIWYLRNSNDGGAANVAFGFGNPTDTLLGQRPGWVLGRGASGLPVSRLQARLDQLGFWIGRQDGTYGDLTEQAVFAFDKYVGLPADGRVDARTRRALARDGRVQASSTTGDLVEVDKTRQLLFLVRGGRTVWAFNTSTGNEQPYSSDGLTYSATTPVGNFQINRQIDGWRTSHLGRLYRPKYFTWTGIAVHGSTSVPPYAASHGCVRLSLPATDYLWASGLAPIGTRVWVHGALRR